MSSVVTIRAFETPEEAHLVRIRLEAAGIEVFLADEYTAGTDWGLAFAIRGVKVLIREEDRDAAERVLGEAQDPIEPLATLACPECGSERVKLETLSKRLALASLVVLVLPLPFTRHRYRCLECSHRWKQS